MGGAICLSLAAAVAAPSALPDIEIGARIKAREVNVEQQGRVEVRLEPEGGSRIDVERNLPRGRSTYRNLELRLKIEARLADPSAQSATAAETASQSGE